MKCLQDSEIIDFVLSKMPESGLSEIDEHLDACFECQRNIADVAKACFSTDGNEEQHDTIESEALGSLSAGSKAGRYLILGSIGAGAMGIVYAAYDPHLDRKIALKLIRPNLQNQIDSRLRGERLQREARAMARLSHPNVTTVHDVGTIEDQVFIAMEYVDGVTLRSWLQSKTRTFSEVLEIFSQAGRGLAAAHAAGLIHRDFKPDNVFIDQKERALVGDFGLVRMNNMKEDFSEVKVSTETEPTNDTTLTQTGMLIGTARYMAPELHQGWSGDEHSDQFSFCVALYEALYDQRPFLGDDYIALKKNVLNGKIRTPPKNTAVPKRIWLILSRGMSNAPQHRHSSMLALVTLLCHDSSIAHRRWLAAGALACIVGLAFFAWSRGASANNMCTTANQQLIGVWDTNLKTNTKHAFKKSLSPNAADIFSRVERQLDGYSQQWISMYSDVCEATHVHGSQSEEILDIRMQCLARRKSELRALVDTLGDNPDSNIINLSVQISSELLSVEECTDVESLSKIHTPEDPSLRIKVESIRTRLDQIFALKQAGKFAKALRLAQAAAKETIDLNFPQIRARALILLGSLQIDNSVLQDADLTLRTAIEIAADAQSHQLVSKALLMLATTLQTQAKYDELLTLQLWLKTSISQAGALPLQHVTFLKIFGALAFRQGDLVKAQELFEQAQEVAKKNLTNTPLIAAGILVNIGMMQMFQGNYKKAQRSIEQGIDKTIEVLGTQHPRVADDFLNLSTVFKKQGNLTLALRTAQKALTIYKHSLPPEHLHIGIALNNIGTLLAPLGRYAEAQSSYEQALTIKEKNFESNHPEIASTHNNIGSLLATQGKVTQARPHFLRALKSMQSATKPNYPQIAMMQENIASTYGTEGRLEDAMRFVNQSIESNVRALGPEHPGLAKILRTKAEIYRLQGNAIEALATCSRALAMDKKLLVTHPSIADDLDCIGESELALQHPRKAILALESSLLRRKNRGQDSTIRKRAETRFLLAKALWKTKASRKRSRDLARLARKEFEETEQAAKVTIVEGWLQQRKQ